MSMLLIDVQGVTGHARALTQAASSVARMILTALHTTNPERVLAYCDATVDDTGRVVVPADVALTLQTLAVLDVPWHLVVEGASVDYLAAHVESAGTGGVAVLSPDPRLLAVTANAVVLSPAADGQGVEHVTADKVRKSFNVGPDRLPALFSLIGDRARGVAGVPSVNRAHAVAVLEHYPRFPDVGDDPVPPRLVESVAAVMERKKAVDATFATQRLYTDVELPREVPLWSSRRLPGSDVYFAALGDAQLERLLLPPRAGTGGVREVSFQHWAREASRDPLGTALAVRGTIVEIAGLDCVWHLDMAAVGPLREHVVAWLESGSHPKIVHNVKRHLGALEALGVTLRGVVLDTAVAWHTIDQAWEVARRGDVSAASTALLAPAARANLSIAAGGDLLTVHQDVDIPLAQMLCDMEAAGVHVDQVRLADVSADLEMTLAAATETVQVEAPGLDVNLLSSEQVERLLFDELGLPTSRVTRTGMRATDSETLDRLFESTHHPVVNAVREYRSTYKLLDFVSTIGGSVDSESRVHTTFDDMGTVTGRLTSSSPSLHQVPGRTEVGQEIRSIFTPGPGFDALMTADYNQLELRVIAHLSGDERLCAAITSGEDIHAHIAALMHATSIGEVTGPMREASKAITYGLAYGLGAAGLARKIGTSTAEASRLRSVYLARFPGIRDFLERCVAEAKAGGGITYTITGRPRQLPELLSSNPATRARAERQALNAPIQGSAADIMKYAMLKVDHALKAAGMASRVILQIHDELVLELAPGEHAAVRDVVERGMREALPLSVPLDVSIGMGGDWRQAAHS